jgi:hypothetical protein
MPSARVLLPKMESLKLFVSHIYATTTILQMGVITRLSLSRTLSTMGRTLAPYNLLAMNSTLIAQTTSYAIRVPS